MRGARECQGGLIAWTLASKLGGQERASQKAARPVVPWSLWEIVQEEAIRPAEARGLSRDRGSLGKGERGGGERGSEGLCETKGFRHSAWGPAETAAPWGSCPRHSLFVSLGLGEVEGAARLGEKLGAGRDTPTRYCPALL